ncbi:MAG: S49 family peptidase, partial [Gammaproteobacteria bacterium]
PYRIVNMSEPESVPVRPEHAAAFAERMAAELLAHNARLLKQQKNETFWRNIRIFALAIAIAVGPIVYFFGFMNILGQTNEAAGEEHLALVRLEGMITPATKSSAIKISAALKKAFEDDKARAVVLLVNSPGGTPVQAALIHERIRQLRAEHPAQPIVVVAHDVLTSGAYYVATAADEIYVNKSTLTGSIGVIMKSFGLARMIEGLDIERRVFQAGAHKNRMDPFTPLADDDSRHITSLIEKIHGHFIEAVRTGRGDRLRVADEVLFSGDVWTGEDAVAMGLVDGISDLSLILRKFEVEHYLDYTPTPSVLQRVADTFATTAGSALAAIVAPQIQALGP